MFIDTCIRTLCQEKYIELNSFDKFVHNHVIDFDLVYMHSEFRSIKPNALQL